MGSTESVGSYDPVTLSPRAGSGTSKKLAKRNAAAKMLLRVHTVPLDAREGNEAEPDDDHFSIVSGLRAAPHAGPGPGTVCDAGASLSGSQACCRPFPYPGQEKAEFSFSFSCRPPGECVGGAGEARGLRLLFP